MAKTNFSIKSFFIIIAGFIIALSLTFLLFSFFQQGGLADDSVTLNDHWNLSINDTHYSDVSLSDTLFPETNKGDYVTLSCTLPDTGLSHAQLILFSCHSTLNVSINAPSDGGRFFCSLVSDFYKAPHFHGRTFPKICRTLLGGPSFYL